MSVLHVNRMEFIAEDYLARCAPELAELMTGKLYTAQVARLVESIRAQRASTAANGGGAAPDKALVQEQMDLQNDLMNTIWATLTGLGTDRKQKPQVKAALAEVSAHVLPKRPSARMSAIRRVDAAQGLAPLVEAHAKSLAAIPCLGGGTVLERAREALEIALRLDPGYRTAHENLGDVLVRLAQRAYEAASASGQAEPALQAKLRLVRDLTARR